MRRERLMFSRCLFLQCRLRDCCPLPEREFVIDNLLVRIHCIIVMIRWTPRLLPPATHREKGLLEGTRSGSEEGAYLRLIDFCITQL